MKPSIAYLGEHTVVIRLGDAATLETNRAVHHFAATLGRLSPPGMGEPQPGFVEVACDFDPAVWSPSRLARLAADVAASVEAEATVPRRLITLPVVYDNRHGLDLQMVADQLGGEADDVVRLHSEPTYHAFCLGFSPGFAYLGPLPERLRRPRRNVPRQRLPAGSVAIAAGQTAVYPSATPGGWHVLGWCPVPVFCPWNDPPVLIQPGDAVRFRPIAADEAEALHRAHWVERRPWSEVEQP